MKSLQKAVSLFPFLASSTRAVEIGLRVCIVGNIMDALCINGGGFLDDPGTNPLEEPEKHSFHCLLDVKDCRDSGYQVLGPKNPKTGLHCLGFRIDDTDAVVAAGAAVGQAGPCDMCTGGETAPTHGWSATVKGTVSDLGDGTNGVTGTPILTDVELLDASVGCEEADTVPPLCLAGSDDGMMSTTVTDSADCTQSMCEYELTPGYMLKYQVNESEGSVKMEATYDGEAWVGIAFSEDGSMVESEAVLGIPGVNGDVPQKYNLGGKTAAHVVPMEDEMQTLKDASVQIVNGQTIMKFTKMLAEKGEIQINPNVRAWMLWAYGSDTVLAYHKARSQFQLALAGDGGANDVGTQETIKDPTTEPDEPEPSELGDQVCIVGYIMDALCINNGGFLDAPDINPLEHPEEHSFHCLLDVEDCQLSGYQVLGPKDPVTGLHCLGYRIDDTAAVVAAGAAVGKSGPCNMCTNDAKGAPEKGWMATVKGNIMYDGDGTTGVFGTPILTNIKIMDASVGCGNEESTPPLCIASDDAPSDQDRDETTKPDDNEPGDQDVEDNPAVPSSASRLSYPLSVGIVVTSFVYFL